MEQVKRKKMCPAAAPKPRYSLSPRTRKVLAVSAFVIFLAFCGAVFWFVGRPLLDYIAEPEAFRAWVNAHGFLGRLAFVGMTVLQIVVALIPGEVMELGAGYAFGFWEGTLLCMVGAVIGSLLVFALVRTFGVKLVEVFFPIEKIHGLKFLQNTRRLNLIVFLLFFIPGTPKDLMAYFVGLTPMKWGPWIFISTVARIPSIITSTIVGSAVGDQQYTFAIVVFVFTILLSVGGLLGYRALTRHEAKKAGEIEGDGDAPHQP